MITGCIILEPLRLKKELRLFYTRLQTQLRWNKDASARYHTAAAKEAQKVAKCHKTK